MALTTACFVLTFVCLFALKADNPMIQLQKQEDRAGRISRGKYLNWPTDEKGKRSWFGARHSKYELLDDITILKGNVLDLRTSAFEING